MYFLLHGLQRQPCRGQRLFLVHCVLILRLSVICRSGADTFHPETLAKCFILRMGESLVQLQADDEKQGHSRCIYLLPIAPFFCHHLPQCLQHFDAQAFLILLQQLFGVFDQSGQGDRKSDEGSSTLSTLLHHLKNSDFTTYHFA